MQREGQSTAVWEAALGPSQIQVWSLTWVYRSFMSHLWISTSLLLFHVKDKSTLSRTTNRETSYINFIFIILRIIPWKEKRAIGNLPVKWGITIRTWQVGGSAAGTWARHWTISRLSPSSVLGRPPWKNKPRERHGWLHRGLVDSAVLWSVFTDHQHPSLGKAFH